MVGGSSSSFGGRVAAGWARAEGMVTKVLLLAIFLIGLIAQFVKPVGDALEGKAYLGGALLSLVGYVLYAEVQRLNAAHETQRDGTGALRVAAQRLEEEVRRLGDEVQQLKEERLLEARDLVTADDLGAEFVKALQTGEDVHFSAMGFTGRPWPDLLGGYWRESIEILSARYMCEFLFPTSRNRWRFRGGSGWTARSEMLRCSDRVCWRR